MRHQQVDLLSKLASVFFAALLCNLILGVTVGDRTAFAVPPAPTTLTPVDGAIGPVPFTISWSAVTDPSGAAIVAYNWQLSRSSTMTPVIAMDSINLTQDIVSGLPDGSYFWRVQAVNSAGQQGAWSAARRFNAVGAVPGTLSAPVLAPTRGYSTFHPWESVHFSWSAVPGAPTYRLETSNDPNFPLGAVAPGIVTFWNDNIRGTTDAYVHSDSLGEGTFFVRVFATDSDFAGGIRSLPSNVIQYTVFFNNPIGPAPVLMSPVNNPTLTLPVTLTWAHVPNPQASGYAWEIAKDSTFSTIEVFYNQSTDPSITMISLTPGPKFWRVLSQHGLSSLNPDTGASTNANTAWSTTGRFTISSAPPVPASLMLAGQAPGQAVYSGDRRPLGVQLTALAPAGGANVALTSSHPGLVPVPPAIAVPAGFAQNSVETTVGQVTTPTAVTITATLNGVSLSGQFTVMPPTLNNDPLQVNPVLATGGATMFAYVDLEGGAYAGVAPAGGYVVNLSTNSAAATVPATVTIPAGFIGVSFAIQTSPVATSTPVTITASAGGRTTLLPIRLAPSPAPASFFVRQISTTGYQGVVTAAEAVGFDQLVRATSSNPTIASVPNFVAISAGSGVGYFDIPTAPVTVPTVVTISVTGGGVTMSAPLTVNPLGGPSLAFISVNPTRVVGGTPSTGTVTLTGAALAGGAVVSLSSQLPGIASVPPSVTVAAGATSASFTVTTFPSSLTTVPIGAQVGGTFLDTPLNVTPPPVVPTLSAVSLSPTSVVGGNSSTGTVTLSAAAPSGGALVSLSDDSSAATVPASITIAAGTTSRTFTVTTSTVANSTSATVTASYAGVSRTATLTMNPATPAAPSLLSPASGTTVAQPVTLHWSDVANVVSYEIQVDNSSTIAAPFTANPTVTASQVTLSGLPAQQLWWRVRARNSAGVAGPFSSTRRFTPQAAPATASLSAVSANPTSVVGPASSTGTATLTAAAPTGGAVVNLSSNNAAAIVPASVTVPAGATSATFTVTTTSVSASTTVTLTGTYNGTNRTTTLTVTPVPPPASLNAVTLNPTSVTGGATSQGTVTLTNAAPSGGAFVSLSSNAGAATVPASVTVATGATSANFTVSTTSVTTSTSATITAVLAGVTRTAALTVNPAGANVTLTVTATGRSGERITSSPAGINVAVGSTQSASFSANSSITLSVSNGRDAIWSGACSSGGNKTKTCTFTITGNASVSANVQ